MRYEFEKSGDTDIVTAFPESKEDQAFLLMMAEKKPVVQGLTRPGNEIEMALINFVEKKPEPSKD